LRLNFQLCQLFGWHSVGPFRYWCGTWLKFYDKFDVPVSRHTRQVVRKNVGILTHHWNIF
jgi:hypothetical protein